MNDRQLLLLLIFLPVVMAVIIWDLDTGMINQNQQPISNEANLPSTILDGVTLSQYDQSGVKSQKITSEQLISMSSQEMVAIEAPVIALDTSEGSWIAQGQKGEFHQQENRLSLFGEVMLKQEEGDFPVQMRTDHLDYHPIARLAETDSAVIIEAEGHYVESLGIQVDLANSIFVLSSRVRSRHEPL